VARALQPGHFVLELTAAGLYCPAGGFHVDPWEPVARAVVTHAHGDHLRWGCDAYLVSEPGERVARRRLPDDATVETLPYGEAITIGRARVSLHPAGHILGSSQVRVETAGGTGGVAVVSGDYKTDPDPTCAPFEPVPCDLFVTESTFGLPVFRWPPEAEVFAAIAAWWRANREAGRPSVLFAYALGKAQRLLAGLLDEPGEVWCHGAVVGPSDDYRAGGALLPPLRPVADAGPATDWSRALIVAPPGSGGTAWIRRFKNASTAFASGWMRLRGTRRRRGVERGFVLSDHADWPGLLAAIEATGANQVWVTHGYRAALARYLREEKGLDARAIETRFEGETREDTEPEAAAGAEESGADTVRAEAEEGEPGRAS
jgi:putative mRNA 3-end processing factor